MAHSTSPIQAPRLFFPEHRPEVAFPIQAVQIDWERLIAKRPMVIATLDEMPVYLLKPEVLALLDVEKKHATYRLILDLMWSTGARVSEVLALTRESFVDDGYGYGVVLKTLKQRPGRPSRAALQRSAKRYVPIVDALLRNWIETYLKAKAFRAKERLCCFAGTSPCVPSSIWAPCGLLVSVLMAPNWSRS